MNPREILDHLDELELLVHLVLFDEMILQEEVEQWKPLVAENHLVPLDPEETLVRKREEIVLPAEERAHLLVEHPNAFPLIQLDHMIQLKGLKEMGQPAGQVVVSASQHKARTHQTLAVFWLWAPPHLLPLFWVH